MNFKNCKDCDHCVIRRDYTEDSWEYCERWDCLKQQRNIRRYVDWYDKKDYIPTWCPYIPVEKRKQKLKSIE